MRGLNDLTCVKVAYGRSMPGVVLLAYEMECSPSGRTSSAFATVRDSSGFVIF